MKTATIKRTTYRVNPESIYWAEGERYCFAKPTSYAIGAEMGDCWLVDANGRKHPGYNTNPLPFHINSLAPAR